MHAGIPGSQIEFFNGGLLFGECQQFLDQAGRFLVS